MQENAHLPSAYVPAFIFVLVPIQDFSFLLHLFHLKNIHTRTKPQKEQSYKLQRKYQVITYWHIIPIIIKFSAPQMQPNASTEDFIFYEYKANSCFSDHFSKKSLQYTVLP